MLIKGVTQAPKTSRPPAQKPSFKGAELRASYPFYAPLALPAFNQLQNSLTTPQTDLSQPISDSQKRLRNVAASAGLLGGAILLRRFPSKAVFREHLIPTDWKIWAKAALGVGAVGQAFQAIDQKPPLWLNALTTVTVIHPLIAGFSQSSARKLLVLGPMVAGLAQGTSWFSDHSEKWLDEKANIPPLATKLTYSAGMMAFGLFGFPPLLKSMTRNGLLGEVAKKELDKAASVASSQMAALGTCIRGCCAGSAVCVSELSEFGSAIWTWLTEKKDPQSRRNIHP